jgi:sugar O-acyltransferase (sialic acid O-acetyltransferase NeuD family)
LITRLLLRLPEWVGRAGTISLNCQISYQIDQTMKPIVVLGAGGYAQEVAWIIDDINARTPTWDLLGYIDPANPQKKGQTLYGRPILGGFEAAAALPAGVSFACGIGQPSFRKAESEAAEARGWQPVALVHPSTIVARYVSIGDGTIIGAGSIVAPNAQIGRHCAINLHVSVGHDSSLGDFCVLSPGVRISGHAQLGAESFVGANASVYVRRRMGRGSTLGANSFLVTDLAAEASALGIPAVPFARSTGAGTCTAQESKRR